MNRIAVYGSLRRDEYNHRGSFATGAKFINKGIIRGAELVGGNAYPWIVESDNPSSSVVVEVYDLPNDLFDGIEAMEIGAGYERRPVKVELGDDGLVAIDADAYFYTTPADLANYPRITSGDWRKREQQAGL
jgi:gamma-glutamylcyclotransferase (GGCT)/AIG2-like uncharacterized protein YtfP